MGFKTYLIKKGTATIATFFVIATIIFFLFRQVGNPVGLHISDDMSPEEMERIRAEFGLNEPVYVQYFEYLQGIVKLEFGDSFYYSEPTAEVVIERLFNSLLLTVPAIAIAYFGGVLIGIYLGWRRGHLDEQMGLVVSLVFRSTPRFWLGLILIFIFGAELGLLPYRGMLPPGQTLESHLALLTNLDFIRHIILPIASMTFYIMGLPMLLMRTSMLEVINEDFIEVVKAKGAKQTTIMYRHAGRNALLPVTTAFGVAIGFAFGGNILVETVFSYPGIGKLMVDSVFRGDFPVAQFSFLIMAGVILIMNFLVDLGYGYLDPRVTHD